MARSIARTLGVLLRRDRGLLLAAAFLALVSSCAEPAGRKPRVAAPGPSVDFWELPRFRPVDHAWIDPDFRLSAYPTVRINPLRTRTDPLDGKELETIRRSFAEAFGRRGLGSGDGGLRLEIEAWWFLQGGKFRADRREILWYEGSYLQDYNQALGIDLILYQDSTGKPLAKMRHASGGRNVPEIAIWNVCDDIVRLLAGR